MKRVRSLDGLRCFAIIAVIVCHYRPPFQPNLEFFSLGWTGVDLFFVISGFLITTILVSLRGTPNPYRVFYWRRTLRIFPPYYLVLALLCAIQLMDHSPLPIKSTLEAFTFLTSLRVKGVGAHLSLLLNGASLSGLQTHVDNHEFAQWGDSMNIFWSLSVEELFYLVWAPIVLRCSRMQVLAISLLAVALSPLVRILCHSVYWTEFFFFPCRIDTLMFGSLLSLLFIACSRGEISRSTFILCLRITGAFSLFCLVSLCLYDGLLSHMELRSALSFATFGYTLLSLFFASVVGLCASSAEGEVWWIKVLRWNPLVYVGTISYTMYLIHIPVWVAFFKFNRPGTTPGLLTVGLSSIFVTVALAAISWRFFEKPILAFKDASFAISIGAHAREDEVLHPLNRLRRSIFGRRLRPRDEEEQRAAVE